MQQRLNSAFLAAFAGGILAVALSASAADDAANLPKLDLLTRTPDQKVVLISTNGKRIIEPTEVWCEKLGMPLEISSSFDTGRQSFSDVHAMIGGSNTMDFFAPGRNDAHKAKIFEQIEEFVANGGHLFLFATFTGRNSERLQTFGIHTNGHNNDDFHMIPGRSEVFFAGAGDEVPDEHRVHSYAGLTIDPEREPITMIGRGPATKDDKPNPQPHPDGPVLTTFRYGRGRVSYCSIEPHADGVWIVPSTIRWIAAGAPTNVEQLGADVVVSAPMVASTPEPSHPKPMAKGDQNASPGPTASMSKPEETSAQPPLSLHFKMKVDGIAQLVVTPKQLSWKQFFGTPTETVQANGHPWQVQSQPTLEPEGLSESSSAPRKLDNLRVTKTHGRGYIVLRNDAVDRVLVEINDVPLGSDQYEFTLEFPGTSDGSSPTSAKP